MDWAALFIKQRWESNAKHSHIDLDLLSQQITASLLLKGNFSRLYRLSKLFAYLLRKIFIVHHNHAAPSWLFIIQEASLSLMQWRLRLEGYNFQVMYKKALAMLTLTRNLALNNSKKSFR